MVEDMSINENVSKNTITLEHCNLFSEHGFVVVSFAVNNKIGKLCVLRRSDYKRRTSESTDEGNITVDVKPFFLIEFYNVISLPAIFFLKSVPIFTTSLESAIWVDNFVVVTCGDGSVLICSPFSTSMNRFSLCPSSIIASAALSLNEVVLGSESGEILFCSYKEEVFLNVTHKKFEVDKRIRLATDEQLISIAASKHNLIVAVGLINGIAVFDAKTYRKTNIIIPTQLNTKTIVWALVFVNELLFAGDSRGRITIFNSRNGAVLKTINSHQNAVLALATNGKSVFAAGVDYRIQVISGISSKDRRFDWANVGQRIIHSNDVTALACVGEHWLVSGGAEHDFIVSDANWTVVYPIQQRNCFPANLTSNNCLIMMKHPHFIEFWHKPSYAHSIGEETYEKTNGIVPITEETFLEVGKPIKLLQVNGSLSLYNSLATISPDASYFAVFNTSGLKVFSINSNAIKQLFSNGLSNKASNNSDIILKIWDSFEDWNGQNNVPDDQMVMDDSEIFETENCNLLVVTALLATNKCLYFAEDDFKVWQLNFKMKQKKLLANRNNAGNIFKLILNKKQTKMIVLTTNSHILYIDLDNPNVEVENYEETKKDSLMKIFVPYSVIDCVFASDDIVLFMCAELYAQIVFVDIQTSNILKVLTKKDLRIGFNQFSCYLSEIFNDQIIISTNKGKVRILGQLEKVLPILHLKMKNKCSTNEEINGTYNNNKKIIKKSFEDKLTEFCRYEPSWGFELLPALSNAKLINSIHKEKKLTPRKRMKNFVRETKNNVDINPLQVPNHSILLIGHVAKSLPTQIPIKIKRYERN